MQKQTGRDALEVVHTVLHAGGKFGGGGYKVSGGLHGVGVSVVNALSEWLQSSRPATARSRARSTSAASRDPVKRVGPSQRSARHDYRVHARHPGLRDDRVQLRHHRQRLRESAYLTKGSRSASSTSATTPAREKSFYFEGGIASFVRHLNKDRDVLHPRPIAIERRDGTDPIEVAIQYNDSFARPSSPSLTTSTPSTAARTSPASAPPSRAPSTTRRASRGSSRTPTHNLSGDDVREGLTAVISVKLTEPQFEGQTKAKLGNAEVKGQVQAAVTEGLSQFLDENPGTGGASSRSR